MKKGIITIFVPTTITSTEIKQIREAFAHDNISKEYRLSICVSGDGELKENLYNFIKSIVKQ
jgi:hypothetical protein